MTLSIVILCWNDLKVISDCIASIYAGTHQTEFEIMVSDNGSTDGSIDFIRERFPDVKVIENGRNLRFAKGNNVGIQASSGKYILILNPDTVIHDGCLDKIIGFAEEHTEAGAFSCRVLNADGTFQNCVRPLYTLRTEWCLALGLRPLAYFSDWFQPGEYVGWQGDSKRVIGWAAGCFILARSDLLKRLGGFDETFFYFYEDTDLCRRIWDAGYSILYTPDASITHLGGQSTNKRLPPMAFALDGLVTRYLYFYKYYGLKGTRSCRRAALTSFFLRWLQTVIVQLVRPTEAGRKRQESLRTLLGWNYRLDVARLVSTGEEPELHVKLEGRVVER